MKSITHLQSILQSFIMLGALHLIPTSQTFADSTALTVFRASSSSPLHLGSINLATNTEVDRGEITGLENFVEGSITIDEKSGFAIALGGDQSTGGDPNNLFVISLASKSFYRLTLTGLPSGVTVQKPFIRPSDGKFFIFVYNRATPGNEIYSLDITLDTGIAAATFVSAFAPEGFQGYQASSAQILSDGKMYLLGTFTNQELHVVSFDTSTLQTQIFPTIPSSKLKTYSALWACTDGTTSSWYLLGYDIAQSQFQVESLDLNSSATSLTTGITGFTSRQGGVTCSKNTLLMIASPSDNSPNLVNIDVTPGSVSAASTALQASSQYFLAQAVAASATTSQTLSKGAKTRAAKKFTAVTSKNITACRKKNKAVAKLLRGAKSVVQATKRLDKVRFTGKCAVR